jgi:cytochrome P450
VIPSPNPSGPRSFLGHREVIEFRRNPLAFLQKLARVYGDVVHFRLGWKHAFLLNNPDLVRELLVTNASRQVRGPVMQRGRVIMGNGLLTCDEPLHTAERRLMQPAFHRDQISRYATVMTAHARRACQGWCAGHIVDLHQEMMRVTLSILGEALFNVRFDETAEDIASAVTELMSVMDLVFVPFSCWLVNSPLPRMRRLRSARSKLDRLIYEMIYDRLKSGKNSGDLLSLLLQAHAGNGSSSVGLRQIRDECLTTLLAGHETIANALTYSLFLLAQQPCLVKRLRAEVDQVAGEREFLAEDVVRLELVHAVLAESMRLYPPVWVLARTLTHACLVGPYTAPTKSMLFVSPYLLHRDPRFFAHPDSFDPDRFLKQQNMNHPAYFPFGIGPRRCIGEGFARMEGVLVLATILRDANFELLPQSTLVLDPKVTLRPRLSILARFSLAGVREMAGEVGYASVAAGKYGARPTTRLAARL